MTTEKDYPDGFKDRIEYAATIVREERGLTYRSSVNIEAALRNAVQDGLTLENAMKFLEDVLDNLEYCETDEECEKN